MATLIENRNGKGQVISTRIQAYSKDERGNRKLCTATVKKYDGLSASEYKKLVAKKALLFEEGLSKGFFKLKDYEAHLAGDNEETHPAERKKKSGTTFSEVASDLLNYFLQQKTKAYYSRSKKVIEYFAPIFGDMEIRSITKKMIKDEIRKLQSKKDVRTYYRLIPDIKTLLSKLKLTQVQFCEKAGIHPRTYAEIQDGKRILIGTAQKVCKALSIDFDKSIKKEIIEGNSYRPATVASYRRILSRVFSEAEENGYISENPMTNLRIAKDDSVQKVSKAKILNKTEVKVLNDYLLNLKSNDGNRDYVKSLSILIPLHMGLRLGEVLGLKWSRIDFATKKLTVNNTRQYITEFGTFEKGTKSKDSERTITIPDILLEQLREFKRWWDYQASEVWGDLRNGDYLFMNWCGKPLSMGVPTRWLNQILPDCNLKHITYHGLRHTNVSLQIIAKIPIKTISARIGHKDCNITLKTYAHLVEEDEIEAAEIINNIFL